VAAQAAPEDRDMTDHTVKSFTAELDDISGDINRMGGIAEEMVSASVRALMERDFVLADAVVARDPELDAIEQEVERKILRVLALRQPVARDLRQAISALKISSELERIGDLAKNIAKRARLLDNFAPMPALKAQMRMGRLVVAQLKRVLDAWATLETEAANSVWMRDEEVDEHYTALFRELLTYMIEDPRTISGCAHLLFVAKNLERMGDHCTNIAEEIHFLVTGQNVSSEKRPKVDVLTSR
jgi:phosphate transport system protein